MGTSPAAMAAIVLLLVVSGMHIGSDHEILTRATIARDYLVGRVFAL